MPANKLSHKKTCVPSGVLLAARNADWEQVAHNHIYGAPCFRLERRGKFCLRAMTWDGHNYKGDHKFVSLAELLASVAANAAHDFLKSQPR